MDERGMSQHVVIDRFPKKLAKTVRKVLELIAGERYKFLLNDLSFYLTCGSSSGVEHHVANVVVVGSNPISRFCIGPPEGLRGLD